MEEQLKFPADYEKYCRLGFAAFSKEAYTEALYYFEHAYHITEAHSIHRLMVIAQMELGHYDEAKAILLEKKAKYLTNLEDLQLYFELLLKTHEWITAHYILADYQHHYIDLKKQKMRLEAMEHADHMYREDDIHAFQQQLLHGKASLLETMQQWKDAVFLPLDDYVDTAAKVMINSETPLVVRATLLESLQHLQWEHTVQYLDFDHQLVDVIPKNIEDMHHATAYQRVQEVVRQQFEKSPEIYVEIQHILPVLYLILLPTPSSYMNAPVCFVRALTDILGITQEELEHSDDYQQAIEILHRLQQ